ncbi:carboxymuconolactone decarboxylase family protein [Ferrimonas sediminicola]|uniref:Carboxymuconolactone decarboxylase family protein n=1 Tax=Ferrimonas sediminicola TaxID=2569538 RepID=A0A4U1BKN2_9GAMM|nr:carboxymuconolactone decarboxylase family protein [Ferrimonas sediminicola]TKB50640.1 carboxymuconolactone decarboxylase family protein [Ferrimonas sediminicola]
MISFTLYSDADAPADSKPLLAESKREFGIIPNLHAVMAESPRLLQAYKLAHQLFCGSSFSDLERTVVWQAINGFHECHYCLPVHSAIAQDMGIEEGVIEALKSGAPLDDPRLQLLRDTTVALVRERGRLSDAQIQVFLNAGFTKANLLDMVLAVGQKVMSNYTNHLAHTPVDEVFEAHG